MRTALANSRKEEEEVEVESEACGLYVAPLSAVFAETIHFLSLCGNQFGSSPRVNPLVLMEMNDTLSKVIIDCVCGGMGGDCPPVSGAAQVSARPVD